jgi:hypothetical protein
MRTENIMTDENLPGPHDNCPPESLRINHKPILVCDVPLDGNEYEAFLYKILVIHTNKFYIGYHVGTVNDGYWHSSKCPIFAKEFAKGNNQVFVLNVGTKSNMIYKERRILDELNAKQNVNCYNLSNGGGGGLVGYSSNAKRMEELTKLILSCIEPNSDGELKRVMMDKNVVHAYAHYQTRRFKIVASHSTSLRYAMDDMFGDLTTWKAIVVCDFGDGEVVFGGNHTDDAAYHSKHVVDVPVIYVPSELTKGFTPFELDTLSKRLNPLPKTKTLDTQDEEVVDWLKVNFNTNDVPVNHQSNRDELHNHWNISHQKITALFKKAEASIDTDREVPEGFVWIDWTTEARKGIMDINLQDFRNETTMAVGIAAGMPKIGDVMKTVYQLRDKKKTHLVLLVNFGSPKIKKAWDNGAGRELTDMIEYFLKDNAIQKVTVRVENLATMERTASLTIN